MTRSSLDRAFSEYWDRLPATARESQMISEVHERKFGKANRLLLQGAQPTEERVRAELENHCFIHLATHGFFQPKGLPSMWEQVLAEERPRLEMREEERKLSGLVFAGANENPEVMETAQHRLVSLLGLREFSHSGFNRPTAR